MLSISCSADPRLQAIAAMFLKELRFSSDLRRQGDRNAVRVAWRNGTMHVEKKYTEDEAEHLMAVVGGLMKKLACRMYENGEPKARCGVALD